MVDNHQGHLPHQHNTQARNHPSHVPRMTRVDWPVLRNNKSQEFNDNIILMGNYFKDNKLQHATTTAIPHSFTPIVRSCPKYSQPTVTLRSSYHSNNLNLTTTQQPPTQDHYASFTLYDTTGCLPNRSINRVHCSGDLSHNPHRSNQNHARKLHDNLPPNHHFPLKTLLFQ